MSQYFLEPAGEALPMDEEASHLLKNWKVERAFRVSVRIGRVSALFAIMATVVDVSFRTPFYVLLGDVALLFGSMGTLYFSRRRNSNSPLFWMPLYFGVWGACTTSLWSTGGLHSPFIGAYLALFCITGLITQSHVRPLFVMIFVFLNLVFWSLVQGTGAAANEATPENFIFLINGIVLLALMVCVFEFLKTERQLAGEILQRYRELAETKVHLSKEEAANSAKSFFLANISHELRTPLSAILGYTELLQDPETSDLEREQFITTIHRNGTSLFRLVNDLLDLSKIEAGKIEMEKIPFNPREALFEVVELLKVSAQKKNIELSVNKQSSLPESFVSDPYRFKQILTNVIGNAIKFTEQGQVEIFARSTATGIEIEVTDTGRGLSAEEQQRLFQPFSQGHASVSRKFGGTGLGLNLSLGLAQILGGNLKLARSEPLKGSSFIFTLPTAF